MRLQTNSLTQNFDSKLNKICYLINNSKKIKNSSNMEISKNLPLYLYLIEKPINLLFSIDQFIFEFSKKTYKQKKSGEFFQQLKERKKLSIFYGDLPGKQLVKLLQNAKKIKGYFSKNLVALLESRLDVVLYRSGLVTTIAEGRQLIKHNKVQVNHKFISSPSIVLKPGDILSLQKLGRFSPHLAKITKDKKQKPQTGDLCLHFQKHLDFLLNQKVFKQEKSQKQTMGSVLNRPSKIFCNLLTQLICTQIKLRSFWNTKRLMSNSLNLQSSNLQKSKVTEKNFLTLFKWKCLSRKNVIKKKLLKIKTQQHFPNDGCLKKNPVFWVNSRLKLDRKTTNFLLSLKKKNKQFSVQKTTRRLNDPQKGRLQRQDFRQKIYLPENYSKQLINQKPLGGKVDLEKQNQKFFSKKNILLYRKSFILFLKQINNHSKFSNIVSLKIKDFLTKKSFIDFQAFSMSKKNGPFGKKLHRFQKTKTCLFFKELNFRAIRPLNFEISYNILTVIYLYSPQRVNFPFSIDFDLIKRSLR